MKQFNNLTNKTISITNVTHAKTFKGKLIGLLASPEPCSLYFQSRWGIHTFGMKYPIDIIILDNACIVRARKSYLQPWSVFFWNPKLKHILEMPPGTIEKKNIYLGDKISIQP